MKIILLESCYQLLLPGASNLLLDIVLTSRHSKSNQLRAYTIVRDEVESLKAMTQPVTIGIISLYPLRTKFVALTNNLLDSQAL
jgi:hypothetical protein